MLNKLLAKYKKRESEISTKIHEIAGKVLDDNRETLSDTEHSDLKKYKAELRTVQAQRADVESLIAEELENRSIQNPTEAPLTKEQIEEDAEAQERATAAGGKPAQKRMFSSFGEQLRAVVSAGRSKREDPRLEEINKRAAATGLSENVDAEGGYWLEPEAVAELLEKARFNSVLFNRVQRRSIKGRSIRLHGVDEKSRVKGQLGGGIALYPADEADAYIASKPKFKKVEMELKKLIGLAYMTDEELDDIPALESRIMTEFGDAFGTEVDGYIYDGDGASMAQGMLRSGSVVQQAIEVGQTLANGTIKIENVIKMRSRLLPGLRKDSLWLVNQELEPYLMLMMIGTFPAYMPIGGFGNAPEDRLLSLPVEVFEHCKAPGTVGDISLVVPKRYLLIEKNGIQSQVSIHVRFLNDEQVLKFTYRFDGRVLDDSPITPRNGTNTLGSVVTLGART